MKQSIKFPIPNKLPGEEIIYFIRKHWYFYLFLSLMTGFVVLVWFILLFIFDFFLHPIFIILDGPIIIATGIFFLLLVLFFLISWMTYYFDIVILTNHRIIEIDQRKLFERSIIEVEIIHVEDVSVEVKGLVATLFGYGTVSIQTAGTKPNLIIDHIPYPYIFAREITSYYDKLTQQTNNNFKNNNQQQIPQQSVPISPVDDELREIERLNSPKGKLFSNSNNEKQKEREVNDRIN